MKSIAAAATASRQLQPPTAIRAARASRTPPARMRGERLARNSRQAPPRVVTSRPRRALIRVSVLAAIIAVMDFEEIRYEVADRVLTITLNRPDKLNAYTPTMQAELLQALDAADADDDIRVIVFTGAGRGFCAGADLSRGGSTFDWRERQATEHDVPRDGGGQVVLRIFRLTKPVIAAINGPAVGVGATMTLPMDIRLASQDARMGFVFARRGIIPEACSSWFLPRV